MATGLTHDQIIQMGLDENNLPAGYYRSDANGGGGGGGGYTPAPFNFDFAKANQDALNQLTPYYEQKLALAKGDVELAKQYIEQDYQKGIRIANENYNTVQKYDVPDIQGQLQQEQLSQQEETRNAIGDANKRGVYVGEIPPSQSPNNSKAPESSYYKSYIGDPMAQKQQLRTLAIQRALSKTQEVAGLTQSRAIEDTTNTRNRALNQQDQSFRNTQLDLNQEKQDKALTQYAPMAYQQAYTQYKSANQIPS